MKTGWRRHEEHESDSGADEQRALGVAARNPSTQHEGVGAETQHTKKWIGGVDALEQLHGKSKSPAVPNPSSKEEPALNCVVAGGRRNHEVKIDRGGASQIETENRKKDSAAPIWEKF
jgi:hypothetical protein